MRFILVVLNIALFLMCILGIEFGKVSLGQVVLPGVIHFATTYLLITRKSSWLMRPFFTLVNVCYALTVFSNTIPFMSMRALRLVRHMGMAFAPLLVMYFPVLTYIGNAVFLYRDLARCEEGDASPNATPPEQP